MQKGNLSNISYQHPHCHYFGQMLTNEQVYRVLNELMVQCQSNGLVLTNQKATFILLLLCCVCFMYLPVLSAALSSFSHFPAVHRIAPSVSAAMQHSTQTLCLQSGGGREGKEHAHTTMAVLSV